LGFVFTDVSNEREFCFVFPAITNTVLGHHWKAEKYGVLDIVCKTVFPLMIWSIINQNVTVQCFVFLRSGVLTCVGNRLSWSRFSSLALYPLNTPCRRWSNAFRLVTTLSWKQDIPWQAVETYRVVRC
jgi:hypothetical protein